MLAYAWRISPAEVGRLSNTQTAVMWRLLDEMRAQQEKGG
jgi:hypothetical protein